MLEERRRGITRVEGCRERKGGRGGRRADDCLFPRRSFFASTYTTLRTLLPLLPAHPLTRRITGSAVGPYEAPPRAPVEKRVRLKSAQRFTVWLAATDISERLSWVGWSRTDAVVQWRLVCWFGRCVCGGLERGEGLTSFAGGLCCDWEERTWRD